MSFVSKALSRACGLVLLLAMSAVSCTKDDKIAPESNTRELPPNVELSLETSLVDSLEGGDVLKGLSLYGGTDDERRRPLLELTAGTTVDAYLYFAYADKGANGEPTGTPTLINEPYPITFQIKENKAAGAGNGVYVGLVALKQGITINNIANLRNKVWFMTGVIGATKRADGKLEFTPNNSLISQTRDAVAHRETREVAIPYTFPWSRISLSQVRKGTTTTDVIYATGLRFKPRGVFMRFNVQNTQNYGMYVMKSVRIPDQTDYAASALLNVQSPTVQQLTTSADFGFSKRSTGAYEDFSFVFGDKQVQMVVNPAGDTQTVTVKGYKHVIGNRRTENPYIINPNPKSPYFWLWLADVKPGASTLKMSIIGDPLGRLKSRQNFTLNNIAIPAGKKGITLSRVLNVVKYRPYTPLEFVARGNAVRSGYGNTPEGFEVGRRYSHPGGDIVGLWNAGANFGDTEVYNFDGGNLTVTAAFKQKNRFIPTANDWRTIIPVFPQGNGNGPLGNDRQWADERDDSFKVWETDPRDVMGSSQDHKMFGSLTQYTFVPLGQQRMEFSRFRETDGTYKDVSTIARYHRLDDNSIVGYRYLKLSSSLSFEERREYFCAYRMDFVPGDAGGLRVRTAYIGDAKMTANATDAVADADAWFEEIKKPSFWAEKEREGEIIDRKFPRGGWWRPGTPTQGFYSRYFINNLYANERDLPLVNFEFSEDGWRHHFVYVRRGITAANNMLLRYFVTDPAIAYEEWGSRN